MIIARIAAPAQDARRKPEQSTHPADRPSRSARYEIACTIERSMSYFFGASVGGMYAAVAQVRGD